MPIDQTPSHARTHGRTVHGYFYNRRAIAAQKRGDHNQELEILLEGVSRRADTPYTYDRSAALLERSGRYEEALRVCETWFLMPLLTRVSGQVTEAKIAERRVRLLERTGRDVPEHFLVSSGLSVAS